MRNDIFEKNIIGKETRQFSRTAKDCPGLAAAGITSIGFGDIGEGYYSGRRNPSFSHLACCVSGTGELYCAGSWSPFTPGMAAIQPAGHPHAARSVKGRPFSFLWVILTPDSPFLESRTFARPARLSREAAALAGAVKELCAPGTGNRRASKRLEGACVKLIAAWIEDILSADGGAGRLERLWQELACQPGRKWSSRSMAKMIGVTPTHLRRLCLAECGMSPMRKLAELRMEQAKTLMCVSDLKMEEIARRLGYANMFAFSTAFKRQAGLRPSHWRAEANRHAKA